MLGNLHFERDPALALATAAFSGLGAHGFAQQADGSPLGK